MSNVPAVRNADAIERVILQGDLSKLSPEDRISYHKMVCESVGLNPLTKPFEYITLNGKLTLYAKKDATDQLRMNNQVSVTIAAREVTEGIYVVTARATLPSGRTDESIGAVPIDNLKGEARANGMMKAETKAKRRVTLSICGLGMLDETEIETIPSAKPPVQRTTEPIPIEPVSAKAIKPTEPEPVTLGGTQTEAPKAEPREPGWDDEDELIDLPRQRALHREFRAAIRNEQAQAQADKFLQDWLKNQGYVGADGKGTTKTIPVTLFPEVKAAAVKYASEMPAK